MADGAITATDRCGRTARFPLDGTETAPFGRTVEFSPEGDPWYILDSSDKGLIKGEGIEWDRIERERLCDAAKLEYRAFREPRTMRPDGIVLRDASWPWIWINRLWPIGLVSASLGKLEVVPPTLAAVVGSLAVLGIVFCFASGVNRPPREAEGVLRDRREMTRFRRWDAQRRASAKRRRNRPRRWFR